MEKKSKAPLIYGYAVCLVAVITFLISITGLINAFMDLSDPLYASSRYNQESIASFENYKMDVIKSKAEQESWNPGDETLKAMYEAEKDDRIRRVKHNSMRTILVSGVLIVICIVLFLTHWRWMRRLNKKYSTS